MKIKVNQIKSLSMFMGFVDGDGCIEIGRQKQYDKKTREKLKNHNKSTTTNQFTCKR